MPRFVASATALRLAQTAKHWGVQSPATTYLHEHDDVRAYLLDEALAVRADVEDRRQQARAQGKAVLPPGQRYSTEADYDDAGEISTLARALSQTAQDARSAAQGADNASDDAVARLVAAAVDSGPQG